MNALPRGSKKHISGLKTIARRPNWQSTRSRNTYQSAQDLCMALRYRYAGVFTLTTFTIILNEELCSAETFQPEQNRSYQCPTFFLTSCIFQSLQVAAPIWHWQQYRADGIHKCLPFFHRKNRWCFCHFSNTVCTALEKLLYRSEDFFDPLGSGQIYYMTDNHIFITLLLCQEVHSKGGLGSGCCSSLSVQYTDIQ